MRTAAVARPHAAVRTGGSSSLTGTWALVRFMLRRDRLRIAAWVGSLTIFTAYTAIGLATLYPSAPDRRTIAATMESPAGVAMLGVNYGRDDYTFGVMMGHQMLWFTAILAALMSVLLVVRHTRVEEATGRAELVRSGVVGRHAMTTATLIVTAVANLALAVALAAGLGATGLDGISWAGSWLYGAAHAAVGIVFAAVAVIAAQVTEHPRGASGMALAVLGLAYALRAVGDVGSPALSWASPIGWAQAAHVYAGDRWWALLPAVAASPLLIAAGFHLSTRRDVGAGLRAPRPGPADASDLLARPLGFAFRLHRAGLIGWCVALLLLGAMYGSVLGESEQMLTQIQSLEGFLPEVAGISLIESFAAMIVTVMAIITSIYAVLAAMRMRSEETTGRAEPVLATALSRARWVVSHFVVAALGGTVVLVAGGLGLGLTGAASTGDASLLPRLLGASVAYAPALWVTAGTVVLLFGVLPGGVKLAWVLVLYSYVIVYMGGILQLPGWMGNFTPFGHVPQAPAESLSLAPLTGLAMVAVALAGAGVAAFRRRDLQSAT